MDLLPGLFKPEEVEDLRPVGWYTDRLSLLQRPGPAGSPAETQRVVQGSESRFGVPLRTSCRGSRPRGATPMTDVTHILSAIEQGDPHAAEQLLPLVYDELRQLAAAKLAQEKPGHTLEATALVH